MELRGAFALAPRSQSDSKPTPAAAPCCCCLSPTFVRSARTLPTSTGALHKPNCASSLRQRLGLGPRGMMQHGRRAAGELSGSNSNRIPHSNDSQQARRNHAAIRTQQGRPASPAAPRRAPDPPRSPPAPCPHSPAPRGPAQARCGAARGGSGAGAGLGRAPRRSEGCGLRAAPQGAAAAPQAWGDSAGCFWGALVVLVPCSLAAGAGWRRQPLTAVRPVPAIRGISLTPRNVLAQREARAPVSTGAGCKRCFTLKSNAVVGKRGTE